MATLQWCQAAGFLRLIYTTFSPMVGNVVLSSEKLRGGGYDKLILIENIAS